MAGVSRQPPRGFRRRQKIEALGVKPAGGTKPCEIHNTYIPPEDFKTILDLADPVASRTGTPHFKMLPKKT
jgi:hypothetical protein